MPITIRRGRRLRRRDDGFAMVTVVGTMFVLTLIVMASLAYATGNVAGSRRTQDLNAAVAAAQVGVEDFLSRLNDCDAYWTATSCPGSTKAPGRYKAADASKANTWVTVPGSDGATPAEYRYRLLTAPGPTDDPATTVTTGLIRLRASGRVNGVERNISVDLRKRSFLEFIYYTDKESSDPDSLARRYPARRVKLNPPLSCGTSCAYTEWQFRGVPSAEAAKCGRYWYSAPGQTGQRGRSDGSAETYAEAVDGIYVLTATNGSTSTNTAYQGTYNRSCEITFTGGDVLDGPLYTKDALLLTSTSAGDPWFKGKTETYWQATGVTPAANPSSPWRVGASGSKPRAATASAPAYSPVISTKSVNLPPTNGRIRDEALPGKKGCRYEGPTRIRLRNDGTMEVTSPGTLSSNAGCGTFPSGSPQVVALPVNGVVYVDPLAGGTACPAGKVLGTYPVTGDVLYDAATECREGDAYVEGVLKGRLTIASADEVVVTSDITYAGGVDGSDVLGLVAQGYVEVYHAVGCNLTPAAGYWCDDDTSDDNDNFTNVATANGTNNPGEVEIDAAILSVAHSFTVQNYDKGPKLGSLKVVGGLYQRHRGAVGTGGSNGTGYLKNYVYDRRLVSLPPPFFIEPAQAPWAATGFSEG